jgi:hypothetical protein
VIEIEIKPTTQKPEAEKTTPHHTKTASILSKFGGFGPNSKCAELLFIK